jgi:vancomycin resistance protein YoaR
VGIAQAQQIADRVNANTEAPLPVTIGDDAQEIPGDALRRLVRLDPAGKVALDDAGTVELLSSLFPDVGEAPVDATLAVNGDGIVTVEEGSDGTVCCDAGSVAGISAALNGTATPPVPLQLRPEPPKRTAASLSQLGVKEKVAEFTTRHPAGAPRVTNIHRIADIVQGAVIEPGDTFSVNDYVGRRTVANGFVPAPIIGENGYFTEDVGGGVSQFATTLFNAAFFAGLEIPAYQAHGIYISRYPYGREATLDYGNIDLRIRNNTPYGMLIWPTYTDSSITVSLYSTRYIEAGQSDQKAEPYGAVCTRVTTTRQRTWLTTGEVKYDQFYATYTPEEGVECDGSRLTNPNAPETTTTSSAPSPDGTAAPTTADTTPTTSPPVPAAASTTAPAAATTTSSSASS